MGTRDKIAFGIYLAVCLVLIAFGAVYFTSDTFMGYHRDAVEMNWEEVTPGMQVLVLALMKMTAAGFFVCSLAILTMLFIPFRQAKPWARLAIPALGIIWNGLSLYVTAMVALNTPASPPWHAAAAGIILMAAAFVISTGKNPTGTRNQSEYGSV